MSRLLLPLLRPVAQGLAITSYMAMAGCGVPTSQDTATPREAATVMPSIAPARVEGALAKRVAPAPMAAPLKMSDERVSQYRREPGEQYERLPHNPVQRVAETPVSTFGVDVDTGSYANVRRFLNQGMRLQNVAKNSGSVSAVYDFGTIIGGDKLRVGAPCAVCAGRLRGVGDGGDGVDCRLHRFCRAGDSPRCAPDQCSI